MVEGTMNAKLIEATRHFEAALGKPVVPGELASWTRAASEQCSRVVILLRATVENEHANGYETIERHDPDLLHRIQQMRNEDTALLDAAEELDEKLSNLACEAIQRGAREACLQDALAETVKRGIDLVVRIRAQESALQTWYSEALYRDRGIGD